MTVAGGVGTWYFTEDNSWPVARACFRTFRYHLGSIAFGSCIIATVQLARVIMAYIDSQTRHLQDKNILLKILMRIVHCILWCFEKCIKYLTKNAYIFIAIKGTSFCGAALDVFYCLKENLGQMAIVAGIATYLMLIGKVVICCVGIIYVLDADIRHGNHIIADYASGSDCCSIFYRGLHIFRSLRRCNRYYSY